MRTSRIFTLAFCFASIFLPGRVRAQFFDHSYAIVIGIDNYEFSAAWKPLSYAVKDAKAMTGFLRDQGYKVFPLYDAQATKQAIISTMQDNLAPQLAPRDRVLVFFAGHGKTDILGGERRGYIVPYDGKNSSSLISMEELENQSSYMGNARHQLFIMDSCYGGLLSATRDSVVDPQDSHYLKDVTDRIARQVLTAGGQDQEVLDGGPKGHSVFMDAMLEALLDGLADRHGDGYITFSELVAYVTPRASNKYQTPTSGILPGHQGGEFFFKNPKGTGRPVPGIPVPVNAAKRSDLDSEPTKEMIVGRDQKSDAKPPDIANSGSADIPNTVSAVIDHRSATTINDLAVGDMKRKVHDWFGAEELYREAIKTDPDCVEAHYKLGLALIEEGNQNDRVGWSSLGKNERENAMQEEREAIRLNPNYSEARATLGWALGKLEDWDGEIREERKAIQQTPDLEIAHYNLGTALNHKGDSEGAILEWRNAIRLNPDHAEAHNDLAWALCKTWENLLIGKDGNVGDDIMKEAVQEARKAIQLEPDYVEAHTVLGMIFEDTGDTQLALAEYHKALELKSDYTAAQTRYDKLLKRMNSSQQ